MIYVVSSIINQTDIKILLSKETKTYNNVVITTLIR
jgi:hypothetical protein